MKSLYTNELKSINFEKNKEVYIRVQCRYSKYRIHNHSLFNMKNMM